ncbi:MAG: hypothetical protein G01um101418_721 [Parcubacteria group bacterium Gr01-1014_18]|nr:MAG: hypothetical protein Greene041636_711 [Parcubacteria group bacterium Greene0416_36]TSC80213.1 MAG: hypothetical protein G01um101418_721 [Parcubacteria group bacterium Gr01-1014_18]TSC98395.1 MAG: hypothetical protein Greene101420_748 [Parcubacteria group bacterium Greene1014_20]TSD06936.1 MAG: hypothetical protein Greene07142_499 [Parcubacteria group bacterium Greene0714_2]
MTFKNPFRVLWRSSTDFSIYHTLKRSSWTSIAGYFVFLLAFTGVLASFVVGIGGYLFVNHLSSSEGIEFPEFEIENGKMETKDNKIFEFREDQGLLYFSINPSLSVEGIPPREASSGPAFFIVRDGIAMSGRSGFNVIPYPVDEKWAVNKESLLSWKGPLISLFLLGVFLASGLFHGGLFLIYALLFGTILYLWLLAAGGKYRWEEVVKVSILANGPAWVYSTLILFIGLDWGFLYLLIYMFFLLGALWDIRKQDNKKAS